MSFFFSNSEHGRWVKCTCQTSYSFSMTVGGRVSTSREHLAGRHNNGHWQKFKNHQATSSDAQPTNPIWWMVDSEKTTEVLFMCASRCLNGVYVDALHETNIAPEKWMVGRWISFWDGLFSGGWKMNFLLGWPIFRCYGSFRENNHLQLGPLVAGWLWQSLNMAEYQLLGGV